MILEGTEERLSEALEALADEAGALFEGLLAQGAELPFEIEPTERGPLPMYQYHPRTADFIRSYSAELRRLEAYVEVCELAGEEAATGFLIGLWDGRSEFAVTDDRLRGAIDGVLASLPGSSKSTTAGQVVVPLVGFRMPASEVELDGVRIVRADSIDDLPTDAIDLTRSGRNRRPGFVALVSCGMTPVAPAAAIADDLRRAIRTIRLFKPGAVGMSAYGWSRHVGGWERFGTGASRPRPGGYRLTGNEVGELEQLSRRLIERGSRLPALAWACSRFDLGGERASVIEALSDYLLALRGLLEGGGPARAGLSARVAALCTDPSEREPARITVERSLTIERKMMSGGRFHPDASESPLRVIAELEELLRRLLKGMATGELGGDLRATADEILLADGMSGAGVASAAQSGETAEWRIPEPEELGEIEITRIADGHYYSDGADEADGATETGETSALEAIDALEADELSANDLEVPWEEDPSRQETTRMIAPTVEVHPPMAVDDDKPHPTEESRPRPLGGIESDSSGSEDDWFASADGQVEWPAFAKPRRDGARNGKRATQAPPENTDRVRYLFPVPDSTDWDVGELPFERKKSS
ncbi:MAG: hypothetical protein EXQ70_10785 [Solirubrobacterales bacterium]|nr:hypothetical protein [Solirubrobacterales bacterium]